MSTLDKWLRATGIVVIIWAALWLGTFGIAFISEVTRHMPAHVGLWIIIPIIGSFITAVVGCGIATEWH